MLVETIQRLEARFDKFIDEYRALKAEHGRVAAERDALLKERQAMREELDRILSRLEDLDQEAP